jgi:hypothetical protein
VPVKAKGPIPSYCADCRRKRSRSKPARPATITCERCGAQVDVRSRGPIPRFCRDGCQNAAAARPAPARAEARPAAASGHAGAVAVAAKPGLRPWDRTEGRASESHSRRVSKPETVATAATATLEPAAPAFTPTITRMEIKHPGETAAQSDLARRQRTRRIRQALAVAVWVALVIVVALILLIGSRPAPPDFASLAQTIT